jgi:hypothetical protein
MHFAVSDLDLDAVERLAVIHDPTSCFGKPIGCNAVRWSIGWWTCAPEHDDPKQ